MHRRRSAAASPPESDRPPNFISALNQLRDEDGSFKEWGFVIYRTAGYDSDAIASDIKERIESDIDRQFNITWVSLTPDRLLEVQRAKEKFRLMWVEDADLNGATPEEAARRYWELEPPFGLGHNLFLCVDESSVKSIQQQQSNLAHVLAVAIDCGQELTGDEADDERWTGSFKVAISSLITELFPLIGDDSLGPYQIGVGVTPDLVWTDTGRSGRQQAGVS
ncbi:hypothetical protein K4F52_007959 [Lecanicillium sp. MT-2017a]|nr:hypothetical protein K4F52_007959 [Lecanicillium sp. MT-2017a]